MAQEKSASENMTFLTAGNAEYIAHLYNEFLSNPARVDASWKEFFEALNDNEVELLKELKGASWTPAENKKSARRFDHLGAGAHIGTADAIDKSLPPANDAP